MIPKHLTDTEWDATYKDFRAAEELDYQAYSAWLEANQDDQREGYDEWVRQTLEAGGDIASLGYVFYDIDDNGSMELLIGRDGYCVAIYWEQDGKTEQFANAAENLYICEGGKIVYVLRSGETHYHFVQMEKGSTKGLGSVRYVPGHPESEYQSGDPEKWGAYYNITKEEYDAILDSYARIPIPFVPLTEYPLQKPVSTPTRIHTYPTNYSSYEEMIRIYLTNQEERWSRWAYDIQDLDGDGKDEMIWREDDRYFIYTMVGEQVCYYSMIYDGTITVCQDGIIQAVTHYGPQNYTIRFYRLNRGQLELVEYLRYDVDRDPEELWFRSPDLTGQDFTLEPISEMEAKSIIASYDSLDIDMTPIADYPFE